MSRLIDLELGSRVDQFFNFRFIADIVVVVAEPHCVGIRACVALNMKQRHVKKDLSAHVIIPSSSEALSSRC